MPKISILGFIMFSFYHGAALFAQSRPCFRKFDACSCSTLLPGAKAAAERRLAPLTGLAPLRGSLRAAPITFRCGWAGVPLSAGEIIARQLAKAAFGWMSAARHLIGPFLCSFLHRWSSRILRIAVPFQAHPLDVIQSLDMYFSSCTRGLKKDPLMW